MASRRSDDTWPVGPQGSTAQDIIYVLPAQTITRSVIHTTQYNHPLYLVKEICTEADGEFIAVDVSFDKLFVLFLVALFDAKALDVVNEGEEDMSVEYSMFGMSEENGEDHRCSKGNVEMPFPSINILKHAMSMYTIEGFLMFKKEFIDGAAYKYKGIESSSSATSFEVWGIRVARESHGEEPYQFRHVVTFNKDKGVVECSCKMFTEVGILCSPLSVLHACCVEQVPGRYIIRRWCKGIKDGQNLQLGSSTGKEHVGCSFVWKMQILRKMNSIITTSQVNKNARAHCEKYFMELKELVEFDVGSIHCDKDGQEKVLNSLPNVINPPGSRQKGIRNKRFNNIVEKKCNQIKLRKSKKLSKTDNGPCFANAPSYPSISYSQMLRQITLPIFNHSSLIPHDQHRVGEGSFPPPSFHPTYFFHSANSSLVFMPVTTPLVVKLFEELRAAIECVIWGDALWFILIRTCCVTSVGLRPLCLHLCCCLPLLYRSNSGHVILCIRHTLI
ncbi:hypothetical protein Cgig2_003291 [Carnegiea gigantea]|uniref:Protein FAR1-RELATED SEQUENCE n=1 Tax=Carnegiea gigantea TaxID=171969 RepID=A0A9Q1JQ55_9CARY|nr:hypothetical protein Cgig2_003291 [Carnegiea gigantea]